MDMSHYDRFYENHGKCPTCGSPLVAHYGCAGVIGDKNWKDCPDAKAKFELLTLNEKLRIKRYHKCLAYKYEPRNLDIQDKKSYSQIDN